MKTKSKSCELDSYSNYTTEKNLTKDPANNN